jgi:hypothetical protein
MRKSLRIPVNFQVLIVFLVTLSISIGACNPTLAPISAPADALTPPSSTETHPPSKTPFEPVPNTATPTPTPTPVPAFWIAPYIPDQIRQAVALPEGIVESEDSQTALLRLEIGSQDLLARWVFALVAPFPTVTNGVSSQDILGRWQGGKGGPFDDYPLLMNPSTYEIFSVLWGTPAEGAVKVLDSQSLLDTAWAERPSWAIIPFEALEARWKVLEIDGRSPLRKEFDPGVYLLTVPFTLAGDPPMAQLLRDGLAVSYALPLTNRDAGRLTTVILTGVTALVRATAETMRRNGITYPAKDVGPIMRQADITHVSNEVPFAKNCPQPDPWQTSLTFCSRPEYIELMEEIGTDIVELTGDHFADWGPEAMHYTLDMYDERGWIYYGGGRNREDGQQARLMEHNGNRIAFIGCNAKGGGYATASQTNPGAVKCDHDWMHAEIARLTSEGYNVITTFQHFEYYTYKAQPNQEKDSRGMADAGAVIVSGSQAHQPQGFEFHKNALIHYGLGNLFFDQYHMGLPTGQGFLDRHVFYDGRYLGAELIGIRFVDFARPRLMTPEERTQLLNSVFEASGW